MSDHARSALKQRGISGHTATVMITEAELQGGDPLDPDFWHRWSDMELMRVPGLGKHALREIRQFAPLPSVTPTMIERVARAFAGLHIVTASGSVVRHTDLARAAIEAMREPTEAMIKPDLSEEQEFADRFYWAKGSPCCAGCDWWRHMNTAYGDCTRSAPVSEAERWAMTGITGSSLHTGAGHVVTSRDHRCGGFKDTFDWRSLPPNYLRRIGYREGAKP